jgi:hypothetical protein
MTATGSKSPGTAKHLIESMTGSEALPAFVRRIEPNTLKHLVEEIGIEDSGALIAHASRTQLTHLLDETLWRGARPGDPEKLSVAELLRWLDVLNGIGLPFAADTLYELGGDFCTLAFSRLLVVSDTDLAPRVLDEHTQMIGTFLVRVRVDDEWDTVQTSLNALWRDYPDFTEHVFGRLGFRHSTLNLFGEDDTAQVLDADAGHAYEQGREEAGYVTSVTAGAFLRGLARADVDVLAGETEYDLQTREYFRRRYLLRERSTNADESGTGGEEVSDDESADEVVQADPVAFGKLEAELAAWERAQHQPTALLTGPEDGSVAESDWIRLALSGLQGVPEQFDRRMDELTYLANLLMVGVEYAGERMESRPAARLALATCNLGASHELWLAEAEDPVETVRAMLMTEPGLVRLFRVGWHLLANLPMETASGLTKLFADEVIREHLAAKPWVLKEVDALLGNPSFEETVAGRDFEDARETLKILGIALEAEAVVVLCVLIDGVPRFPRVLEDRPPEGAVMTFAARDIATMSDLMRIHRFLDGLGAHVRL